MSLLARVVARLGALEIRFALIGAAAMAFHGASRATLDIDLLTVDASALDRSAWSPLESTGVEVEIRPGDPEDPLAGVVRFWSGRERAVDLVIGKPAWQRGVLDRALAGSYAGVALPVVRAADLVLLKLYVAGPQDAWDIHQLLAGDEAPDLIAAVEAELGQLGEDVRALWERILENRYAGGASPREPLSPASRAARSSW